MEISNKTLALFLVAAVAISLFGTVLSLNKMNRLAQLKSTTGFALSDTGTAQVQINSTTSIVFKNNAVDFGSGSVNSTGVYRNCTLITGTAKSTDCIGFNTVNHGLELENDGNTNVSVTLMSNATAADMFGAAGAAQGYPQFKYNVSVNETGTPAACVTPLTAWTNFTLAPVQVCDVMNFDGTDSLNISIWINIPYTVTAGVKAATITATATEV